MGKPFLLIPHTCNADGSL